MNTETLQVRYDIQERNFNTLNKWSFITVFDIENKICRYSLVVSDSPKSVWYLVSQVSVTSRYIFNSTFVSHCHLFAFDLRS